jgi:outer membrane lipoprotein-sorting protein
MKRLFLGLFLAVAPVAAASDGPTIEQLLDATDDINRGASSTAVMRMEVKTDRYERSMKMSAKSKGEDNSLIVILEPAKDAGIATLKVGDNLWNYMPKVDRTMKIPAGMMSGSWMGSHLSNDDLVRSSRLRDDFTYTMTEQPTDGVGQWVIELVPKPDAPVVWGKVVTTIRADQVPTRIEYFDEKGALVRTLAFDDVKELDGRKVPMTMSVVPAESPEEYTRITYEELDFGVEHDDKTFSLQALKN